MIITGIERGDGAFRHFTFDEDDVIYQNGVPYYKVNYGKNKDEGEGAEDEIGFVKRDSIMPLGGKKLKPLTPQAEPIKPVETPTVTVTPEKPKRGRPTKVKTVKSDDETYPLSAPPVPENAGKFEYCVQEFHSDHQGDLQNQLNKLGQEGWEMCGFDMNKSFLKDIHIIAIFKRKL